MLINVTFQERTYHTCGKEGHLARGCQSIKRVPPSTQTRQDGRRKNHKPRSKDLPSKYTTPTIDQLEPCLIEDQASSDRSILSTSKNYPMFTLPGKTRSIVVTVQVQGVDLPMELDTGASLSLISETTQICQVLYALLLYTYYMYRSRHCMYIHDILVHTRDFV